MSEVRPPLAPSLSFSAIPSSSSLAARPQKRRASSSSQLQFFTPSASSFKPHPYTPNADSQLKNASKSQTRAQDSAGVSPLGMDPQPSDPNVVFIHPPFNVFPESHLCPNGLTYSLMAENTEWFLDPSDFVSPSNYSSNAVPYPPHLEPPRGWCPAKKKDLKERGADGWPEGEEPRLRCTFCRRTYAGVNAKSMWRRHVFEKHKIAMSNRRDGSDRPRGRGANKENRQLPSTKGDILERIVNLGVAPQSESRNVPHKSRFRSQVTDGAGRKRDRLKNKAKAKAVPLASANSAVENEYQVEGAFSESSGADITDCDPLALYSPTPACANNSPLLGSSEIRRSASPINLPLIPPSPYNPLLTPSFRHSSPRRPSEQPWRFPSPSHPLHSRSRDLSLSFLIRGTHSPLARGSPTGNNGTPRAHGSSPLASPSVFGTEPRVGILDFDSPAKSSNYSPISILYRGRLSTGTSRTHKLRIVEESPLSRSYRRDERGNKRSISDLTDDWLPEVPIDPPTISSGNDPFASIWSTVNDKEDIDNGGKSFGCSDAVSPVLRSVGSLPSNVGLGIGLLDPFTLSDDGGVPPSRNDSDFDGLSLYPPANDDKSDTLASSDKESPSAITREPIPPTKKRRTNIE